MKVVIVGGVAGGATAAARIRRLDEHADIVVFERSGYVSYANCGLPYYIGGIIDDAPELTLQTPESFFSRFRVDMRVRHAVTAIHPGRKTVSPGEGPSRRRRTGERANEENASKWRECHRGKAQQSPVLRTGFAVDDGDGPCVASSVGLPQPRRAALGSCT